MTHISDRLIKIKETIDKYKGAAHVLTPIPRQGDLSEISLPPYTRVAVRTVWISTDKTEGEVYSLFEKPDDLILSKIGLQKLGSAAGISWSDFEVFVNDDEPFVAAAKIVGTIIDLDGSKRSTPGRSALDLRDGGAQAKKKKPGQLAVARSSILSLVETGAKCRVRRELLGLQGSYKIEDLNKPFIIFTLIPDQEAVLKDFPILRQTLAAQKIGIEGSVFGISGIESDLPIYNRQLLSSPSDSEEVPPKMIKSSINDIVGSDSVAPNISSTTHSPLALPTGVDERAALQVEVSDLYIKKVRGGRSPNKPPLSSLSIQELKDIKELLIQRPDIA